MAEPAIAVIGAGMAGTACAEALAQAGRNVQVFDKGRSVGGRLAQRRRPIGSFDHGAQYMTGRDAAFIAACERWQDLGSLAVWEAASEDGERRWIGIPGMNAPIKAMLQDIPVATNSRIAAISRHGDAWQLTTDDGKTYGLFDELVIAIPPVQARDLIGGHGFGMALDEVEMAPCWAAMIGFHEAFDAGFELARLDAGGLAWAALNGGKPGRSGTACWTLHASPEWSEEHLDYDAFDIGPPLLAAFSKLVGSPLPDPDHLEVHRWRYAMVKRPLGETCLYDADLKLGVAGDWCLGPRVEAAYLSGKALAARMLDA